MIRMGVSNVVVDTDPVGSGFLWWGDGRAPHPHLDAGTDQFSQARNKIFT